MKRIAILGSTGSIGRSALSLIRLYPERFRVVALSAGGNADLLFEQCRAHQPELAVLSDREAARTLAARLPGTDVRGGEQAMTEAATWPEADLVLSAVSGAAGLVPTWEAVRAGKDVALANKEAIVMAGDLLMELAAAHDVSIIPVDSEHSALHQCLRGSDRKEVHRLVLTASGGPFRTRSRESLARVSVQEALAHPTWNMGPKITIDSATLMNKGLEVIEAHHLFGFGPEQIAVAVHPQSVVHSLVEFIDGTLLAQMSITDMRSSLLYAFTFPERLHSRLPEFDLFGLPELAFEPPDLERFPCLRLAYAALESGGTAPTALNAANEAAVELFLAGALAFSAIPRVIEQVLDQHRVRPVEDLSQLREVDRVCREQARLHGQRE